MARLDHLRVGLATLRRVEFVSTFFWLRDRLRVTFYLQQPGSDDPGFEFVTEVPLKFPRKVSPTFNPHEMAEMLWEEAHSMLCAIDAGLRKD